MIQMRKDKKLSVVKAFIRLAPTMFLSAPIMSVFTIIIGVFSSLSFGMQIIVQQNFFDSATSMVLGNTFMGEVWISLGMLGGMYILCQVLNGVSNYMPEVMFAKIIGVLSKQMHEKVARLDPVIFEDTNKLDDINKAGEGKNNAVFFVYLFLSIFTFYIPYFIFVGWYLFSLKPILAVAVVIVFIPTAMTQIIRTKYFANLEQSSAPVRRECEYYEKCVTSREYFKETRLLGGFDYFRKLYLETLDTLQKLKYKATMKSNRFELCMRMVTVAGYFCILLLLFAALMQQEITVGAFAAVFNSIGMIYSLMEELICRHFGNLAESFGSIQNYLNFLDMDERKGNSDITPDWGDIVLDNVSFAYPKAEKSAVKNVSFTLKKGETLAVVGENGSGKSTLIRLISGLYLPKSGVVTHNGTDTKDLTCKALYENTSAVFQKYGRYQMLLEDNITISESNKNYDDVLLDKICEQSGTDKTDSSFPNGYKTMLSREFDGVDLSGGEWQRVAIARGFFRSHNLIILDEPTAAIDPYEETRVYNRFAEISKDKSAVIVTHRLGSVKLADRIVVMKNGEVAQIGTHKELIEQSGEYRKLYESQEQWYKDNLNC